MPVTRVYKIQCCGPLYLFLLYVWSPAPAWYVFGPNDLTPCVLSYFAGSNRFVNNIWLVGRLYFLLDGLNNVFFNWSICISYNLFRERKIPWLVRMFIYVEKWSFKKLKLQEIWLKKFFPIKNIILVTNKLFLKTSSRQFELLLLWKFIISLL